MNDAATIALASPGDWLERFLSDELHELVDADTRSRLADVRSHLAALLPAVALPLPVAMARILAQLPIAASYVRIGETSGAKMIGAQAIVNLRSLEVLAQEFASDRPDARLRDFVDDAKRRILYDDDPQEAELDLDGVRVLTIHQAKGLEWPYVFVACSTKHQYGSSDPTDRVVSYDLHSGAFALKNDIDGRETFRWLCLRDEHDPNTAERGRNPSNPASISGFQKPRARRHLRNATRFTPVVTERIAEAERFTASTFRPRVSFTALSTFETCPRMARLRYRLLLPDLREAQPRFVGPGGNMTAATTSAARLGSLTHLALELWGRATIAGDPILCRDAFALAKLEFAGVTESDAARARASADRAAEALGAYTLLAVEEPFELAVGDARVEGAVDLIARDANGLVVVIDYKTGRTSGENYALQLALYRRVAAVRYPAADIESGVLRLTPESATFEFAAPLAPEEVEGAVTAAGHFESDVANVGPWCQGCAYRGSPCMAPLSTPFAAPATA